MHAGFRTLALTVLFAMTLATGIAHAQSVSSSLNGRVRTHEGTPVPDVVVRAVSEQTGQVRMAITDGGGRYRFDVIEPGKWKIWAEVSDGVTSNQRKVTVHLQQAIVVDFTVGPVLQEKVTVTAEPPLVDTKRTGGELRIDGEQTQQLPIAGRTVAELAMLDSAVSATAPGNFTGETGTVFSVNGQSGRSNTFLVDGLDNNDQTSNTTMNSHLSQLVIREFVVKTRQYSPEFSRASGGILNVITERGSNDTQAEIFVQGVAPSFSDSGDYVSSLPDQSGVDDKREGYQAGMRMGGPLNKDRAFYFVAYEHMESDDVMGYSGIDRNGVPGGRMIAPNSNDNLFFRADFNLGDSQLMARLSLNDRETNGVNVNGRYTPESGFSLEERDVQLATSLSTIISPKVFNEARLLFGSSTFDQFANSDRPGVTRPTGIFGGNNLNEQIRDEVRIQLVENLTWQAGNHTAKFGIDILRSRTEVATDFNPNGNFIYNSDVPFEPGDCGNILFSMVDSNANPLDPTPCPGIVGVDDDMDTVIDEDGVIGSYPVVYTLIDQDPEAVLEDTRYGLFIQDSWQATPNFLLDYGLRYDLSTFTLPKDAIVDSSIPNGGAGRDTDNIAPRLGFAWSMGENKRTVLRGGAGLFYDKLVLGFPAVSAITSGTEIQMIFPQDLTLELTEDLVEEKGVQYIRDNFLDVFPTLVMRFSTGTELETPYNVQYSFGFEQGVGTRGAFSATVTRSLGYNIPLFKDLNPVIGFDVLGIPQHPDPNTGSIAAIVTEGRNWYSALDLGWKWQGKKSWYKTGYTWSKSIDDGPDPLKDTISLPPNVNLSEERALSDSDRRHRLVLSGATQLPWWDLNVSGIAQFATGLPYNVITGQDDNLDGIITDRPTGVGRNTGEDTDLETINAERRYNRLPEVEELDEPDFIQVDLRIGKPFSMRGGRNPGELYVQVFNVFDKQNGGQIDGSISAGTFGEPIGVLSPPRTVELGFRIGFGHTRTSPEIADGIVAVPAASVIATDQD